jgi:hypothetical protein
MDTPMPSLGRLRGGDPVHHGRRHTDRTRKNGDTHVTGMGLEQTIDCHGATLLVDGTRNTVNALGTCWAVTVMGSGHTVYGSNESVFYKSGQPFVWDRGRELGMTNRISQVAG